MEEQSEIREGNLESTEFTEKDDDYKAQLQEISSRIKDRWHECEKQYLDIGRDLLRAKRISGKHGEWVDWLKKNVDFSVRQSQRLMRVAEWFGETTPVSFLDFSKAYILTRIPKARLEDFLGKYKSADADVDPLQVIQNMKKPDLEDAVQKYLLLTAAGRSPGKDEKIEVNSPKASPEDHALDALSRLETTMSELVGDIMSWSPDNAAYDTVVSEIRRLCADTLGKLPPEDVPLE